MCLGEILDLNTIGNVCFVRANAERRNDRIVISETKLEKSGGQSGLFHVKILL